MESVPSWARTAGDVCGLAGGEAGDLTCLLVAADLEAGALQNAVHRGIESNCHDCHQTPLLKRWRRLWQPAEGKYATRRRWGI